MKMNTFKKFAGIILLLIGSYLLANTLIRLYVNPHLWLTIKKLFNGYFGTFSIAIIVFNTGYLFIIFLLFKYGLRWTKLLQNLKI